jgi:hypothetical protein
VTAIHCPHQGQHSGAAKRVHDVYNLHKMAAGADSYGRWIACALADGSSDNVLYDDRGDAVRHQHHNEDRYAFIPIRPGSFTVCQAQILLQHSRLLAATQKQMLDRSHRAGGRQLIRRLTAEDERSSVLSILTGSRPSNLILPRN